MDIIFSLMGITFVLVVIIALVFVAAIRSGQFEDLEGPAWRVVLDEDTPSAANDERARGTDEPADRAARPSPGVTDP